MIELAVIYVLILLGTALTRAALRLGQWFFAEPEGIGAITLRLFLAGAALRYLGIIN